MDVHSSDDKNYLKQFYDVAKSKCKNVYAIFDNGAIIYNRKTKKIEIYGKVLKF